MTYPDAWREAVARAICAAFWHGPTAFDLLGDANQERWRCNADAAIRALVPLVVERCAGIADEQASADMSLKLMARKSRDGQGALLHAGEEAAGRSIASALRALTKEPGDGQ